MTDLLPCRAVGEDLILYVIDYTQEPDLDKAAQEVEEGRMFLLSSNGRSFRKTEDDSIKWRSRLSSNGILVSQSERA